MRTSRTTINKWIARSKTRSVRTLGFFIAALRAKKDGDTVFEIKKPFIDGEKVEQLWIKRVTYDGKNFRGQIDNQPNEVSNVHSGERVTVAPEDRCARRSDRLDVPKRWKTNRRLHHARALRKTFARRESGI